jgi:crossover junction endodeoxyribonuclease RuvC
MIVLGFDPGTASTGWGVVEQEGNRLKSLGHGCIVTSAKDPTHVRLRQIYDQARGLITRFCPEIVVLEELFVNVNVKTALAVGQAKGVLILAASEVEAAPCEYSPLQIKMAVTGYGRASKIQVQEMTKTILCLPRIPQPDHAADALAVAICHAHHTGAGLPPALAAKPATAQALRGRLGRSR